MEKISCFVSGKQFAGKTKDGFAHKLPERNRQTRDRKDVCVFIFFFKSTNVTWVWLFTV